MPDNRYFLDMPLFAHSDISLEGDEWHHLTHVMRAKEGKKVEIVNGRGQIAQATLIRSHKTRASLHVDSIEELLPPQLSLILAQALPLPSILPLIIEKGTELGATAFWLFPGERSKAKSLSQNQLRRLQQIAISSMKQCGRLHLPIFLEKPSLLQWKREEGVLYFGDPQSTISLTSILTSESSTIIIGPGSGLSSEEIEYLEKHLRAKGVRLHPNVLRTETAALCALSLLSQKLL